MDWTEIRNEYINGGGTYRQLAAKYGVPLRTLGKVASREGWVEMKQQVDDNAATLAVHTSARAKADMATRIYDAAGVMLDRVLDAANDATSARDIRALTAAIRDIKEIAGVMSDEDREEQRARIEALRARTATDDDDDDTGVIMLPTRMEADDG